jgi:membrane protease YdiL (CAAX protease family)
METVDLASMPLRVVRAAPVRLVVELAVAVAVLVAGHAATRPIVQALAIPRAYFLVFFLIDAPALFVAYRFLVRTLEQRPATELALSGALRELSVGLLVGCALFGATIGVIAALGGYSVAGVESPAVLVPPLATAATAGFTEELLARGIVFRILDEWLGKWVALIASSALFGFVHIWNPHATVWGAIAIALEAGTMLGAAYLLTRRLWLAIGIHAAWNYTQGAVFGVAVSGGESTGLLRGVMRGPTWLSGGDFGAEASAIAVVVCGGCAAVLLARTLRVRRAT